MVFIERFCLLISGLYLFGGGGAKSGPQVSLSLGLLA